MSTALTTLSSSLASKFGMGESSNVLETLKATAFKGEVSDAQMTALLIVADQYGLNPWTKEIYAFPDKKNGIIPVVGVDGWSRIINENPNLDGIEFRQSEEKVTLAGAKESPEWIECILYRKDRTHPTTVREYLDEVYKAPFKSKDGYVTNGPWQSHTKRFLRHKALIQCARLAFGFVGIFDEDEADRIRESSASTSKDQAKPVEKTIYSEEDFKKNSPAWKKAVIAGVKSPGDLIAFIESKNVILTEEQQFEIDSWKELKGEAA